MVHDWTRVEAGIFHDFHTVWIGHIRSALNDGLLPGGYYALAEQHADDAMVDLFPPGHHDPQGLHGIMFDRLETAPEPYDLPPDEPLTLARYVAGHPVDVYLEHLAVGAALPDMPLFLTCRCS